jgi:tRNA (guanine-N1)-methyltransferase
MSSVDVMIAVVRVAAHEHAPGNVRRDRVWMRRRRVCPADRDERIVQHFCSDAVSIGRYVIAGGELAAMVVCDAVMRKLPGALGHADSVEEESFSAALGGDPEYPHYTRPAEYRGWKVPEVLLSGHHEEIRRWRRARSRERGAAADGPPLS